MGSGIIDRLARIYNDISYWMSGDYAEVEFQREGDSVSVGVTVKAPLPDQDVFFLHQALQLSAPDAGPLSQFLSSQRLEDGQHRFLLNNPNVRQTFRFGPGGLERMDVEGIAAEAGKSRGHAVWNPQTQRVELTDLYGGSDNPLTHSYIQAPDAQGAASWKKDNSEEYRANTRRAYRGYWQASDQRAWKVTEEDFNNYARALQVENPRNLISMGMLMRSVFAMVAADEWGVDCTGILDIGRDIVFHQNLGAGDTLRLDKAGMVTVEDKKLDGKALKSMVAYASTVNQNGQKVIEMSAQVKSVQPIQQIEYDEAKLKELKPAHKEFKEQLPKRIKESEFLFAFQPVVPETLAETYRPYDDNPIHQSTWSARLVGEEGLPEPIVMGMANVSRTLLQTLDLLRPHHGDLEVALISKLLFRDKVALGEKMEVEVLREVLAADAAAGRLPRFQVNAYRLKDDGTGQMARGDMAFEFGLTVRQARDGARQTPPVSEPRTPFRPVAAGSAWAQDVNIPKARRDAHAATAVRNRPEQRGAHYRMGSQVRPQRMVGLMGRR